MLMVTTETLILNYWQWLTSSNAISNVQYVFLFFIFFPPLLNMTWTHNLKVAIVSTFCVPHCHGLFSAISNQLHTKLCMQGYKWDCLGIACPSNIHTKYKVNNDC